MSGNGAHAEHLDLERLKQEILSEVRKELLKAKSEIIDGTLMRVSHADHADRLLVAPAAAVLHSAPQPSARSSVVVSGRTRRLLPLLPSRSLLT